MTQLTTKDYFIRKVEKQKREERMTNYGIAANVILGITSLASATCILGTESYPYDSIILECICPISGVVGAALCYNDIKAALNKKVTGKREKQTPSEKVKVYTKNLQREISFTLV